MRIAKLKMKNILSIEEAEVTFGDNGLVLVEGFDYDTNRANGAGKSAIFNGLSFALYDKVPRKITKSEILRRGARDGYSEVSVVTSSGTYKVRRERPIATTYFKDDCQVDMTQEEFEEKIGLNYTQFLATIYNAQDSQDRFIALNDRGKKDFLLKIMNLGNFNLYKKNIVEEVTKIDNKVEILNTKIQGYKDSIAIYKQQMVDPKDIQLKLNQLDSDLSTYNSEIKRLELIQEPDLSKFKDAETNVNSKLIEILNIRQTIAAKRVDYQNIKNLKHDANCPGCNLELIISNKEVFKLDESNKQEKLETLAGQINDLEDKVLNESKLKDLQTKISNKKKEEYKEYNDAQKRIVEYKNSIMFKNKERQSLASQLTKNDDIKSNVTKVIENAKTAQNEIKELNEEKSVLETVAMIFDPTGAPAYIMDNVVEAFNDSVTDYINHIWPNASYSLQTYKENKDKTITSKFSEILMINGKTTSIGSLSGGELRALSLATDFAIINVLSSKFSLNLNPIILDEPFNGLDGSGKEMVIELLEAISNDKEIWVVDHASEAKSLFNRTIRVEKRNGISKILDQ